MKIVFFNDSFYPGQDGVITHITVTAQQLLALGHEVMVVAPNNNLGIDEQDIKNKLNIETVLIPSVSSFISPAFRIGAPTPRSLVRVKKFNPDIIHVHSPASAGLEALFIAKLLKKPLVATLHTYFMEPEAFTIIGLKQESGATKILNKAMWQYAKKFYQSARAIVTPTRYLAKDLKKRWQKSRIELVSNGIDLSKFRNHSNRLQLRKQYQLQDNFVILSVGRLSYEKNLNLLVTAFAKILSKYPQLKLVFVGDGPSKKNLQFCSNALGISKSVLFIGAIAYQELVAKNYYSLGDIFVTPSTFENQSLAMMEAMAAGLPVVAPKVKAMPEIIGKAGILVKPNDVSSLANAMVKLYTKPKVYQQLAKETQSRSENFAVEKTVTQLLKLYSSLLS